MKRLSSDRRRASRRFVPGGIPVGVSVERLEVRRVLSGFDDITPAVQDLMDLIDGDLDTSVGSGDETVYLSGMNIGGTDPSTILTEISYAADGIHTRLNAKVTAWTNYKTILQSDIIRINNYASTAQWPSDWKTTETPTAAQRAFVFRLGRIAERLPECDIQVTRLNNALAWDDLILDYVANTIEYHQQPMQGGTYHWMISKSFAEAEADYFGT